MPLYFCLKLLCICLTYYLCSTIGKYHWTIFNNPFCLSLIIVQPLPQYIPKSLINKFKTIPPFFLPHQLNMQLEICNCYGLHQLLLIFDPWTILYVTTIKLYNFLQFIFDPCFKTPIQMYIFWNTPGLPVKTL